MALRWFASDLLVTDYAGHAFTLELARGLRTRRPGRVAYSYCRSTTSPKGAVDDPESFVISVGAGRTFEKYRLLPRLCSELRYGVNTAVAVWRRRPLVHVVCNMPLVSALVVWALCVPLRCRLVIWFQDAQAGLAAGVVGDGVTPRLLGALEGFMLRRARPVIAISSELAAEARRRRVRADRVVVIENWAPIEALPTRPRRNPWAAQHGLVDRPVVLYSGTLARKHRVDLLATLARHLGRDVADVVVVSEGEGADWLISERANSGDLQNLHVFPYQPFADLPDVLAAADVLVVLLEPNAGRFSVPSKTLSYLCAGRPIVAAVPSTNTAAKIIEARARAGRVLEPHDYEGFCAAVSDMLASPDIRAQAGANGRAYAEANFRSEAVLDRFEGVLGLPGTAMEQG